MSGINNFSKILLIFFLLLFSFCFSFQPAHAQKYSQGEADWNTVLVIALMNKDSLGNLRDVVYNFASKRHEPCLKKFFKVAPIKR